MARPSCSRAERGSCSCGWARSRFDAARPTRTLSTRRGRSCYRAAAGAVSGGHTRARPRGLGEPKRGAGGWRSRRGRRSSPCAITGSTSVRRAVSQAQRVAGAFSEPIPVDELPATPEAAGELIEGRSGPEVKSEFGRLRTRPGLIAAGLAAAGLGAGLAVRRRRRRYSLPRANDSVSDSARGSCWWPPPCGRLLPSHRRPRDRAQRRRRGGRRPHRPSEVLVSDAVPALAPAAATRTSYRRRAGCHADGARPGRLRDPATPAPMSPHPGPGRSGRPRR